MEINAMIDNLKDLGSKKPATLTLEDKNTIVELYELVMDSKFVKTSCNDCYRDAAIVAYNYLKHNGKMKDRRVYKMKPRALITIKFGSSAFLTDATCTDEIAREHLRNHPEDIICFDEYPDNWQEDIKEIVEESNNTEENAIQSPKTTEVVQTTTKRKRTRKIKKED